MRDVWLAVAVVGAATIAFKSVGPVLLGGRALPARVAGPIELLAPAVLAALVVTQLVGGDRELVLDERLAGIAGRPSRSPFALRSWPSSSPPRSRRRSHARCSLGS